MHDSDSNLGEIIKDARLSKKLTQEQLAESIGIGLRHIMALENEGKHPSYTVLYRLIQRLNIPADFIFHPEITSRTIEQEQFIRDFLSCDEREQRIVTKTVQCILRELREITDHT